MSQNYLYRIGNLTCQYFDKKTKEFLKVLDVEDINIFTGEITVILGPSGSGKSTFMEAISLMSQTIDPESENVYYYPHGIEEKKTNIAQLTLDEEELQKHRFENYCFIFQDTNIMGNFNPIENVALPKMVYDPLNALEESAKILRNHLNLRIDLTKEANEYSGGQKQRFALARAFMAKGDLLFGDEPTGNLDKYNSEKLFGVIRQHVTDHPSDGESVNKIGAVIVTHSIELALQFADRIIVIVKPERIDDLTVVGERTVIRGYTNPFLVYRNSGKNMWRTETDLNGELEDGGLLPPIDDDGSTRFEYIPVDPQKTPSSGFIKDRLKKEIIFFLNNSYAAPQDILITVAKVLNLKLKPLMDVHDPEIKKTKDKLFEKFDAFKHAVISVVEENALEKIYLTDFENKEILYPKIIQKFIEKTPSIKVEAEKALKKWSGIKKIETEMKEKEIELWQAIIEMV
jgi:putative ABC transport system ATP-binding protein